MTDNEINIAIAEVCGWVYYDGWNHIDGRDQLLDYCNDSKAMIEAEKWLMNIDPPSWDEYYCSFEKGLVSSTTRNRAENFLKTIGKWKE